jgi:porin
MQQCGARNRHTSHPFVSTLRRIAALPFATRWLLWLSSQYRYFWADGGVYQGIFRRRENDFVSFAVSYARTNPRLTQFQEDRNTIDPGLVPVQTFESIAEVDYNIQSRRWLSLRPNLQYVIKPNGTGKIPNAFVIGLSTAVTF